MAILTPNVLEFTSTSAEQTERLGLRLGQLLQAGDLLCLTGDLGAGKTTLARGIGRGWGTAMRVTSPTFTLINQYPRVQDKLVLFHLDCYRLTSAAEAETLGLEDVFDRHHAVMIEWWERINAVLPSERLTIDMDYVNTMRRSLRFTAVGPRHQALLQAFRQDAFGG
jgi:tRNA threonylcarbamoyladenosine biosynthesis protein TsaE